jgi:hypothetical protein
VTALSYAEAHDQRFSLVDLLDRVLAGGVVISGDVVLALDGVDLVRISLRAVVSSVAALEVSGE